MKNTLKNMDFTLLLIILILFSFGLIMIGSATNIMEDGLSRQVKVQAIAFVIGIVAMLVAMLVDYNTMGEFYKFIYIFGVAVLLLVYVPGLGIERYGARSWINLGVIDLQPAEIAKIAFIISFAKFLDNREEDLTTFKDIVMCGLFMVPFMLFILLQPDLGTALVFIFIAVGMMFASGLSYRIIGTATLGLGILLPLIYKMMKPHQRIRIDAYLHPEDLSLPGNYHVMQSKITIGSGMATGRGIFQGIYHRYDYLPVQETDFIYAVIGEETGFVGGAAIIGLYLMMLLKMMSIARKAKDNYGSLIAIGVTFMFAFQIIENIGMTMGIMPVTGITLPFLSYGGSSLITSMVAIGLLMNVYARRKRGSYGVM
ncbi:MAG: rod shape-determining protein RodA [Clostridia bacterium]|nr:rod shape-determining protein RodA [Clostridia bacterium]